MVALIAALQVKKWLDDKVNDAAFNKTVNILEIIERFHSKLQSLTSSINNIMNLG